MQSVRAMAHLLGLTVVAEGVETEEIRDLMVELGFDVLQGYLFARPMPEADCSRTWPRRPSVRDPGGRRSARHTRRHAER